MGQRVVIVTGAGHGIGQATAYAFAAQGDCVVVADTNQETGEKTVHNIISEQGEAQFINTDTRNPEDIIHLMETVEKTYGRIDVLINNAGVSRSKSPYELTVEEWDDVLNINLRGYFLCAREAAKLMKKNPTGGSIVNIASTRAFMSEPHTEAYAASKGGIVALTHALAMSLSPDHITVNSISPGWIETGNYDSLSEIDHAQHPSGRVGKPADIARACLFLTHPDNNFITGENVTIDGGMTRKMIYAE